MPDLCTAILIIGKPLKDLIPRVRNNCHLRWRAILRLLYLEYISTLDIYEEGIFASQTVLIRLTDFNFGC